jgi:hypothetical protein
LEKRKKEKKRKEKKIPPSMVQFINCIFQSNMFNPKRKRRIGVENTMALGGRLMPKAHSFQRKAPKGGP